MLEGAGRDLDFALWAETVREKGCQHARQTPCLPGWTNVDECYCCCCCCCDYYYVFGYCAACMEVAVVVVIIIMCFGTVLHV